MAEKVKAPQTFAYDPRLLFPVLFLVGVGIVMVYSASSTLALKRFGSEYYFTGRQAQFALIGVLALVALRNLPYHLLGKFTYPLLISALLFLVVIQFTDFGFSAGGSTRWLRIGSFNCQPSEIARFALVVYLAYSMNKKKEMLKDFSIGFLPHLMVLGVFTALILLQPDFGSAAILVAIAWVMMFVGGVRILHLSSVLIFLAPAAYYLMVNADYRIRRLMSFLDPWQYPADAGYQIVHSLMAFGTGGIFGTGIGKGYQKLFYLPEPHTDFIFSVIGEEVGLVGVLIILSFYVVILWRGISIAANAPDLFGSLMATGLITAIGLQVCINMGVTLGLLPTKGLTLPFLSYGGTSLVLNMASVGILMNIASKSTGRKAA